jgi:hypothetical protein
MLGIGAEKAQVFGIGNGKRVGVNNCRKFGSKKIKIKRKTPRGMIPRQFGGRRFLWNSL